MGSPPPTSRRRRPPGARQALPPAGVAAGVDHVVVVATAPGHVPPSSAGGQRFGSRVAVPPHWPSGSWPADALRMPSDATTSASRPARCGRTRPSGAVARDDGCARGGGAVFRLTTARSRKAGARSTHSTQFACRWRVFTGPVPVGQWRAIRWRAGDSAYVDGGRPHPCDPATRATPPLPMSAKLKVPLPRLAVGRSWGSAHRCSRHSPPPQVRHRPPGPLRRRRNGPPHVPPCASACGSGTALTLSPPPAERASRR